jgi:hypothetical protein
VDIVADIDYMLNPIMAEASRFAEATRLDRPPLSRSKALIFTQLIDLVGGYRTLVSASTTSTPLLSRAVLARTMIEATANLNYIGESEDRALAYVDFATGMTDRIIEYIAIEKDPTKKLSWPKSWADEGSMKRVRGLGSETIYASYDYLSNFIHSNNIADHILDKATYEAVIALIDGVVRQQIAMSTHLTMPYINDLPKAAQDKIASCIHEVMTRSVA